jgi:glyoxylate/hydroxypyruvate reductase A
MTKSPILLNIKWDGLAKKAAFERALPDHPFYNLADGMPSTEELAEVKYAVVWKPEHGFLATLPNLEVIFSLGAGVDHVLEDKQLPDLPIVRFVDANLTGRMVEWVVLQVLMHLRHQRKYDSFQRINQWNEIFPQPSADQVTVGIMGFGELGQAAAKGLLPLGFNLCGWSRSEKSMDGVECFHGEDGLESFLARTDILVSLLPYTPATHGILNRSLIEKLSRVGPFGAPVLINAGRGGSQVETDIIACLKEGLLHGVSLDVFETEPLPKESPLWSFENAIITPHMAAVSDPAALAEHVATQVNRYEAGEELEYLVDRARGY